MRAEDFGCPHLCAEEAELLRFRPDPESPYAERLKRYRDIDRYYPGRRFETLTDGIGCTRTFRACLNEYIKHFEPYPFPGRAECMHRNGVCGLFMISVNIRSIPIPAGAITEAGKVRNTGEQ